MLKNSSHFIFMKLIRSKKIQRINFVCFKFQISNFFGKMAATGVLYCINVQN